MTGFFLRPVKRLVIVFTLAVWPQDMFAQSIASDPPEFSTGDPVLDAAMDSIDSEIEFRVLKGLTDEAFRRSNIKIVKKYGLRTTKLVSKLRLLIVTEN